MGGKRFVYGCHKIHSHGVLLHPLDLPLYSTVKRVANTSHKRFSLVNRVVQGARRSELSPGARART